MNMLKPIVLLAVCAICASAEDDGDTKGFVSERAIGEQLTQYSSLVGIMKEMIQDLTILKVKLGTLEQVSNARSRRTENKLKDTDESFDRVNMQLQDCKQDSKTLERLVKGNRRQMSKNSQRIDQYENSLNRRIAFMGVKTSSFAPGGSGHVHVRVPNYEVKVTNIGNAFNAQSGIFTSPLDGVFTFTFSFLLYPPGSPTSFLFLYHNDVMICSAYSYQGTSSQLSNTAVIRLKTGDTVDIRQAGGFYSYSSASRHATFSGALLF